METLSQLAVWCLDSPLLLAFVLLAGGLLAGGEGGVPSAETSTGAPAQPPSRRAAS
jgi:hypothetical protein